jgi:CDP-diacylglycerol---serine O-phosphatidyltransferase
MAKLPFEERRSGSEPRKYRRGIFLLPSLFTVGNLFCGYACVVYTMRGSYETAAPFIGIALVLDMCDGFIARMTKTTSAFGVEFDSLADVISFGLAPAILAFGWGLSELGRLGWAVGFVYVGAAAMRLARFNIQTATQLDKRYFVGLPSPAAAGVIAATVFRWPELRPGSLLASLMIAVVLVPAALMVSTIRFRSFKTLNLGWGPLYRLLLFIAFIAFIAIEPSITLIVIAYTYLLSAFIGLAMTKFRTRRDGTPPAASA